MRSGVEVVAIVVVDYIYFTGVGDYAYSQHSA